MDLMEILQCISWNKSSGEIVKNENFNTSLEGGDQGWMLFLFALISLSIALLIFKYIVKSDKNKETNAFGKF